jgi:hypothetical protein
MPAEGGLTATFSCTLNSTAVFTRFAAPPAPPLSISASVLPVGMVGVSYRQTPIASGGTPPYAWSVSAGALPVGLSLSSAGVISGTPAAAGTSSFTVQVMAVRRRGNFR